MLTCVITCHWGTPNHRKLPPNNLPLYNLHRKLLGYSKYVLFQQKTFVFSRLFRGPYFKLDYKGEIYLCTGIFSLWTLQMLVAEKYFQLLHMLLYMVNMHSYMYQSYQHNGVVCHKFWNIDDLTIWQIYPVTGGFLSHSTSNAEPSCFLCCYLENAIG